GYGVSSNAPSTAITRYRSTIANPIAALRLPSRRFTTSGTGHPRIDNGIEKINQQVDQHEVEGDEEDCALHQRVVPLQNGGIGQPPDAGQREYVLDQHRA